MRRSMLAALAIACLSAAVAAAVPITYTFQATGTGTLGATPFTDASFVITVVADTGGITTGAPGVFRNPAVSSTILITGVGLATFTESKRVFCAQAIGAAGFSEGAGGDLIDLYHASLATYGLDTSFGPVFYATPFPVSQFVDVPTDRGLLTFTAYRDVTFAADLAALVPALGPVGLVAMVLLIVAAGVLAVRRLT